MFVVISVVCNIIQIITTNCTWRSSIAHNCCRIEATSMFKLSKYHYSWSLMSKSIWWSVSKTCSPFISKQLLDCQLNFDVLFLNMWNRSMVLLLNLFLQHMSITICHNFINYFGTSDFVLPVHYWWVCWNDPSFQKLKLESQFYPCNGFPLHAWLSLTINFSKTFSTSCFLVVYTTY
jgi:hypothetical protein